MSPTSGKVEIDSQSTQDANLSPDEIRRLFQTVYQSTRSRLESIRREKILRNLHGSEHHQPKERTSPVSEKVRSNVMLALDSISTIRSCEATMGKANIAPNGLAWVRVSTNLKAPDNYKDKFFVPYLGESDAQQNFSNAVAADADQGPAEQFPEEDISDGENTVRVTPVEVPEAPPGKDNRTPKRKLSRNRDTRGQGTNQGGKASGRKSAESIWDRAARRVALKQLLKKLPWKDITSSAAMLKRILGMHSLGELDSCHKNIVYRLQAYKDDDDEVSLRQSQKKELLTQLSGSFKIQPSQALQGDSIPFFFCRQCYIYNCIEHGTQTARPAREPPDRTKKDGATRQGAEDIESRCPDRDLCQCWCISQSTEDAAHWWRAMQENTEKRDNVKSVVLELFASFGEDPCRISELGRLFVGDHNANRLTCVRVGYLLDTLEETNVKKKPCRQTARRARKKYRTKAPRGETESMKGGQRVDYAPCQHDGPCTAKTCRCVENGVNCEKYCSCNHNRVYSVRPDRRLPCNHAFQGCTCKSAIACISNACVCYSYGRECDPDLCRACFDCKDNDGVRSCRNVGLLLGERQRTVVGRSDTHGWGAFAANDIGKGDIIGEYVGEVVSHTDADRRGRLYDEIDYSFLFNITEDWALDSTRLGNKLRYCNHHFKPNCNAKLMRVGGDVRVGLYAVRDIGRHEELFFDYKYKNGPAWSMPGSEGKDHSHRKREASAKKRALAVHEDDGDDDNEVISVPRKRVRSERRFDASPRNETSAIQRDIASYPGMSQSLHSELKERNVSGLSSSATKLSSGRTQYDVKGEACLSRNGSATPARNGLIRNVVPTQEKSIMLVEDTSERRAAHQENAAPSSRTEGIPAIDISQSAEQDLRPVRRQFESGNGRDGRRNNKRSSSEEQGTLQSPTLRDVFGSDLESLDENINQTPRGHGPDSRAEQNRNRDPAVSPGSALAKRMPSYDRNIMTKPQMQREERASSLTYLEGEPNKLELGEENEQETANIRNESLDVTTTKQNKTDTSLKDRHSSSRHSQNERPAHTDPSHVSSVDVSRVNQVEPGKFASAVPHINLVSDDEG